MAQVQIDYVTIPQRQALRVHCPVEDCKHIWIYQGYKVKGWIACPVCKRQLKLGDYTKDKEVPT